MIKNKTKIIIQFITVCFTTIISLIEVYILYNTFSLEILGTFFLIQSTSLLGTAFLGFRIMEVTQLLFSSKNISIKERNNTFSELFSFYLIILLTLIPISIVLVFILNKFYLYNIFIYLPSILIVILTFILKQLSGFWFAIQYHNNKSERISFYQTCKKVSSLFFIISLYLLDPTKNIIFLLSLIYFANSFIFFIYELNLIMQILNFKTINSFIKPIKTFKKFIFSDSDISMALKTGYLRTLISSWAKNGDISLAALIAGPSGSALLKAFKSTTNLILQLSGYTQPFFMSYLNRNSDNKDIVRLLNIKSLKLTPIIFILSLSSYFLSKLFFRLIYNIQISHNESLIIFILVFIACIVLTFSWAFPLHLLNNKYKLSMYISFLGTFVSYIFFGLAFYTNSLIPLYFSLPVGMLTGVLVSLIFHNKEGLLIRKDC